MAESLMRMLRAGPEVSFNGSPTVSPITAALCSGDPFFLVTPLMTSCPDSMYFLALSQAPPALAEETAIETPETKIPGRTPATAVGPKTIPTKRGVPRTMTAGRNISPRAALVAMETHLS